MPILKRRTRTVYRTDQSFGVPFELNKDSPQAKGLAGWWPPLVSPGANVLRDFSEYNNDGAFPGGANNPAWVRGGIRGQSLSYDGANTYITCGDVLDFGLTDKFSISAWVKNNSLTPGDPQNIVVKTDTTGDVRGYLFTIRGDQANDPWEWSLRTASGFTITVQFPRTSTTDWTDVLATYSGSGDAAGMALYENGISQSPSVVQDQTAGGLENVGDLEIGARNTGNTPWDGLIGDVRIYNRLLSPSDAYQLYAPQTRWDLYKQVTRSPVWIVTAAAPPAGAIMNQLQGPNVGADLFNGTIL